jgi:hypothetical protein
MSSDIMLGMAKNITACGRGSSRRAACSPAIGVAPTRQRTRLHRARTPETSGARPEAISRSDGHEGYLEGVRSSAAVYRTSAGVVRREGHRDGYWNSSFCRHSYPQ